ncbi:MAG TPA: DUF2919 family protein [Steroidobacteraceae bacterium]|nr:DUF2919 family protein [Steroidobacteraceae bacterium]
MPPRYPLSNYDANLCLKPPLLLWLAALFLARAALLPLVTALGSFAALNQDSTALLRGFWSVAGLPASLIAAAVLYALARRQPSAPASVLWLLSHGRMLLAVAAAIDLLCSLLAGGTPVELSAALPPPSWMTAAADVYFLTYILGARRVRDTFLDLSRAVASNPGPH